MITVREVPVQRTRAVRQTVLRPHQTIERMADDEADGVFAAGAFDGARLIAVGLVAPSPERGGWRVRGMATAPDARNRGAGRAVLDALLAHARVSGASIVWCNARTPARRFYERAGFTTDSHVFEIPQIGPHVVMQRRFSADPDREPPLPARA